MLDLTMGVLLWRMKTTIVKRVMVKPSREVLMETSEAVSVQRMNSTGMGLQPDRGVLKKCRVTNEVKYRKKERKVVLAVLLTS
mgnify:CR=1 FL=1